MTNVGKWENHYQDLDAKPDSTLYGNTITYQIAAEFLADCNSVEDWGVGTGGFLNYRPDAIGIDGSKTPFAKTIADLAAYSSNVEGVHMRHVLEHNYDWQLVLRNALKSASKKICITNFIPFGEVTKQIAHNLEVFGIDVPDMQLGRTEFESIIYEHNPSRVEVLTYATETQYGEETVFLITK